MAYADFGKPAKDLLSKVFDYDTTFQWTTGPDAVRLSMKAYSNTKKSGKLTVDFKKLPWNTTAKLEFNSSSYDTTKTTITTNGPVDIKGLDIKLECDPAKKVAYVQGNYTYEKLRSNIKLDLYGRRGLTLSGAHPVSACNGLTIGGQVGWSLPKDSDSTRPTLDVLSVGLKFKRDPVDLSLVLNDKLSVVDFKVFGKVNDKLQAAFKWSTPAPKFKKTEGDGESKKPFSYELGAQYQLDEKSIVKVKINQNGVTSAALQTKISPNVTVTLSSESAVCCLPVIGNCNSDKTCASKFGFGVSIC